MERVYKLNKKRMIIWLSIFLLASCIFTYMSIEDTMKYKKVLEEYDDSVKRGKLNIDTVDILKQMSYDRDNKRYSIRMLRTMIICTIQLIILYVCFLKNSKIVIGEEGIKVYSPYKRKAKDIYPWHMIDRVKFQYGDGLRGFIPEYGMKINKVENEETVFIPIERLLNYNEISQVLIENYPQIQTEVSQSIKKESHSIMKSLKEAYLEYKNSFRSYMIYSFIIFIFALLNVLFKNTFVSLITVVTNIYFGYRAQIAINYKAYMSYKGEQVDFDMGWNYAKSKIGRYFGANMIIGIVGIIFVGIEYLCLISDLGTKYKILLSVVLGIGCLLSICRIYLITYIASIVDTEESYMSLNGMLIKKYYRELVLVVSFLSLQLIPMIAIVSIYYRDIYIMEALLTKVAYINIVLALFVSPYISAFIMKFLGELPVSSGGSYNE